MVTENIRDVDPASNRGLYSWRKIAAYFRHDVRMVRLWEKERALPVYRPLGKARGSIYAFTAELARWLKQPTSKAAQPQAREKLSPGDEPAPRVKDEAKAKSAWKSKWVYQVPAIATAAVLALVRVRNQQTGSVNGGQVLM
jgi:hypothetical protein